MDAMITFDNVGINYITDSLDIKRAQNHRNAPIIGQDGSDISFVSTDARVITCKSLCLRDEKSTDNNDYRINQYIYMSETFNKVSAPLTLDSVTGIRVNGNYFITGFDYTEDTMGNFVINWEFTQEVIFNVTQKTFRVWNKKQALSNAKKKASTGLNSSTKKLLKDCPNMKEVNISMPNSCVKALQQFLQSKGFYTKHKIDGFYGATTKQAVKDLQKKYKLKTTGEWDIATRLHFQVEYKYPTDVSKNKKDATGILKTNKGASSWL